MSEIEPDYTHTSFGVLGGYGFVGSAIVRALEKRGAAVCAIGKADYLDVRGQHFDVLINANGNSKKYLSRKDPAGEFKLSVASVADSLQDFSYDLYVHLSTIDVYPDHEHPSENDENAVIDVSQLSPYGFHKRMAEQLVQYYACNWLIFRMAGFVGPGLWKNSIYDMLTHQPLRVNLDSEYQYLHTDALATGILQVVHQKQRNQIFNMTGSGVITLREIAEMIPGYDCSAGPSDVQKEHYEVNNARIQPFFATPSTRSIVHAFVADVLAGRERIR